MNATLSLVRLACLVVSLCALAYSSRAQTLTSGPGFSLVFNGTTEFVDIASGPTLGTMFTEEAWIFPTPPDDNFHGFLGNQPATATTRAPSLFITNRTRLYGGFGDGAVFQSWFSPTNVLRTNQWNHVAVTYDGSAYRVFVNGAGVLATNISATPSATAVRWIGKVDTFFPGRMDEVRIWNVARTTNEIQQNMYRSLAGTETGLLAYYRLDEGSTTATTDSAAAGGTSSGTLTSAAMWLASTAPVTGRKATMVDTLLIDVDGDGKASPGDRLKYVVRLDNANTGAMNNVVFTNALTNLTFVGGTLTATPVARDDGPTNNSAPGSPFHGTLNTTLNIAANAGLLTNDFTGVPAGTISSFGGGSAGGTVTSFAAGATASVSAGSLTVNADGSLTFVPTTGFNGLFTFQYRLTNTKGSSDATATIAIGERPAAIADARTATGNVRVNTSTAPAFSVVSNDTGDGKALSAMSTASTQGGQVAHLGGGQFTYNPPPGFEGADTFTYTLTNGFGSSTGTVTMTVSNMIWFVDASAGGGGDGRLTAPFNALTGAGSFDALAADGVGDNIFVADGTYVGTNGLVLLSNQKLIGDGSSGTLASVAGITLAPNSDALPAFSGTDPVITTTIADGIILAPGTTVRGITVGNTPTGFGFSGSFVGTLNISESSKIGSGSALFLSSSVNVTADFDVLNSSNAPSDAIVLALGVQGSVTAASGSITNPVGAAIWMNANTVSLTYPGPMTKNNAGQLIFITQKSGGSVTLNGNLTNVNSAANGILLLSNSTCTFNFAGTSKVLNTSGNAAVTIFTNSGSTINFSNGGLDVDTTTATAFNVSGPATVNVTGSGNTINSTTGTAFLNNGGGGSATIDINASIGSTTVFPAVVEIRNRAQANNVTLSGNLTSAGNGIVCGNNTAGIITFSGTSKVMNSGASQGVVLTNNPGATINFSNGGLDVDTTSGTAFFVEGGGTINVTGTGNSINATTGIAFRNLGTLGNANIDINAGITNTTGRLIEIQGRTGGTVTLSGPTTNNGTGTLVQNNSGGGTITFTGALKGYNTGANTAVSLVNNSGTTINFSGGTLLITTTTGTGFNATGGGTITVQGTANRIFAGNGSGLNVANTTIGASGLTFESISSSGGSATGIILDGTGLSGGLTVTGTGGASSGGTIATKTGANLATTTGIGIFLNNAVSVSLTRMQLNDFGNYAIRGTSVTNFTLLNSVINGANGDSEADNEAAVSFSNLRGTNLILNSTIGGGRENNLEVLNTAGTLNSLVVSNCIIQANQFLGNHGIFIDGSGTARMTNTVFSCTFRTNRVQHYRANVLDSAIVDATIGGSGVLMNTMTSGHANVLAADLLFSSDDSALLVFDCINNSINGAILSAIDIFTANTTAAGTRIAGTISGNTIGTTGVTGSGSSQASGINLTASGLGTVNLAITGNTIRKYLETGIRFDAGDTSPVVNATITGNTIKEPNSALVLNGIHVNMGTTAAGAVTACVDIGGAGALANDIAGSGGGFVDDFRLRQRNSSTLRLPGYGGASGDTAAVVAFVQGRNTGAETGSATASGLGGGFPGGAACTQP